MNDINQPILENEITNHTTEKKLQNIIKDINIVKNIKNTFCLLFEYEGVEAEKEFIIQGLVFKIEKEPCPTTYNIFKDGKKIARLYLRRGLVSCYLGVGDVDGKKIYDENHRYETEKVIWDDMCSHEELEKIVSLIYQNIKNNE